MGIRADVQFEEPTKEYFLASPSLEDAFIEIKKRMGLVTDPTHDSYLKDLLSRRLVKYNGQFLWPGGSRSALIYWTIQK